MCKLALTVGVLLSCVGWSSVAWGLDDASVSYTVAPLTTGMKELKERFSMSQLALLEKLNRADIRHLARQKQIVVPDRWDVDELIYSPLPADYAPAAPLAKLLIVDQVAQVFGAYEQGKLVRWGPVSTGRESSPTPPGLYHLNWRSKGRHSTVNREWFLRWYFNFDNRRGLSLHEYELPGLPESHSCVRLLERDARWIFDWGDAWELSESAETVVRGGTPLLVLGEYVYGSPKPWLTADPRTARHPFPETLAVEEPRSSSD